jgi:hypothetical protein
MWDRLRRATLRARPATRWVRRSSTPCRKLLRSNHILGSAAHAARAFELSAGDDPAVGLDQIAQSRILAPPVVVDVLRRYPSAPPGGRRVGELKEVRLDWMEPFAQTINAAKKYVVSSTLEQLDWNAELLRGDLGEGRSATQTGVGQGTVRGRSETPTGVDGAGVDR